MGMTFRELIDYAKKEEASDVHVTVGTNICLLYTSDAADEL